MVRPVSTTLPKVHHEESSDSFNILNPQAQNNRVSACAKDILSENAQIKQVSRGCDGDCNCDMEGEECGCETHDCGDYEVESLRV